MKYEIDLELNRSSDTIDEEIPKKLKLWNEWCEMGKTGCTVRIERAVGNLRIRGTILRVEDYAPPCSSVTREIAVFDGG